MGWSAACFRYYAELGRSARGRVIPSIEESQLAMVLKEPYGVVAAIVPWNYPILLMAWKVAPALAAGNTVVLKPSEMTPLSTLLFAELFAHLPPGVVNILSGYGKECGEPLVLDPRVRVIAFTGGDQGGRKVNELAAKHLKRVTLELGGKSPNIVFDDAYLKRAANGVITGIFSAGGQSCMAGSRLLLQESIHDEFVHRLLDITGKAKLGDPKRPDVQVGPVATKPQFDKVVSYVNIAKAEGAHCAFGGNVRTGPEFGAGQFVQPTIFTNVTNNMRIAQEEVFGPVLSVLKFKYEDDALRIANDIRFGLAAGVCTKSLHRAMYMSERLKAGTVWVNNYRSTSFTTPFGGYKDSGLGREGGIEAVKEFLEVKSVWISTDLDMPDPCIRKY